MWGLIKSALVWEGALRCQEGPLTLNLSTPLHLGDLVHQGVPRGERQVLGNPTFHKGQEPGWTKYLGVETLVLLAPYYDPKKDLESKDFGVR